MPPCCRITKHCHGGRSASVYTHYDTTHPNACTTPHTRAHTAEERAVRPSRCPVSRGGICLAGKRCAGRAHVAQFPTRDDTPLAPGCQDSAHSAARSGNDARWRHRSSARPHATYILPAHIHGDGAMNAGGVATRLSDWCVIAQHTAAAAAPPPAVSLPLCAACRRLRCLSVFERRVCVGRERTGAYLRLDGCVANAYRGVVGTPCAAGCSHAAPGHIANGNRTTTMPT